MAHLFEVMSKYITHCGMIDYAPVCVHVCDFLLFASANFTHRNRSHFCVYRPVPSSPSLKKNRVATIAAFFKTSLFFAFSRVRAPQVFDYPS